MGIQKIQSYAAGQWVDPGSDGRQIRSPLTGEQIALASSQNLDFSSMLDHARYSGNPALRKMTFHDRARLLKALALHLREHREALYEISFKTGATLADSKIDIDGGIGTLLVFASKGRREMPDSTIYADGDLELLSRNSTFLGQHVCTPLLGTAIHINAFNFPVWGMLEKLAPTLLAGMPAIIKPATDTSYLTEACFRLMIESGLFPEGSFQLIVGGTGNLLDQLDCQDVVSFTGSADTALKLRSNPVLLANSVRFVAEQDSLNASVLGADIDPGSVEFDLFVKEACNELTTKAGQKCTAIRRIIAPENRVSAVIDAIADKLSKTKIGDPSSRETQMGSLASHSQKADVLEKAALIGLDSKNVLAGIEGFSMDGVDPDNSAFVVPMLFHCADPDASKLVHSTEAFGPVATVMPCRNDRHAMELLNAGGGSLVASIITKDPSVARSFVENSAAFHGRLYFNNADSMAESTGHGSPLPHMVHGGPGRAGGGEELGGVRGVKHYMQRTAIQGSPDILSGITDTWVTGAEEKMHPEHPFTRSFNQLQIGETLTTKSREVTLEDIEKFAHFTGDTFYAHMDEEAAKANPFFPGRVAHGYLLLSFAAGLFVQPDPGPVLANTGLSGLGFQKPVSPGDAITVRLTVKRKTKRTDEYGEVRWNVTLTNQDEEQVAEYELHTMNLYEWPLS